MQAREDRDLSACEREGAGVDFTLSFFSLKLHLLPAILPSSLPVILIALGTRHFPQPLPHFHCLSLLTLNC